jgi:hypothetical protein
MGYRQGEKVFFVSPTNWRGEKIIVSIVESSWGLSRRKRVIDLRSYCRETQISCYYLGKCSMSGTKTTNFKLGSLI